MNNIQLLIITISLITILAIIIILYKKRLLNRKKITTIIVTGILLTSGITLLFTGSIIVVPAAGNTVYSVWFKSSSYNEYFTTNTSIKFEMIIIEADYLYFNDTCFVTDPTTRLNITIMFIDVYDYIANEDDLILGFYSNASDPETISYIIGGFEASTDYYVNLNGTWMDDVTSNTTGFITFDYAFVNDDYWVLLEVYKGAGGTVNYDATIRKSGTDYFVWMGANLTASDVGALIPGFDESNEYIAIWSNIGAWTKYYGTDTGTDWGIHTFDVVQSFLDDGAGTISFSMTSNLGINYNLPRSINLIKKSYGYNYTGYSNLTATITMSAANTSYLQLPRGYYLALWNQTTYTWNYWISGWAGNKNQPLHKYDVIMTRINGDKTWTI